MIDFSQTKMIFEHLQDEMSRTIFEKRLMYSATKDERYLNEMICTIPEVKYVQAQLEMNRENFLFGAGYYGERFIALTNPQRWAGILDNDEPELWNLNESYHYDSLAVHYRHLLRKLRDP